MGNTSRTWSASMAANIMVVEDLLICIKSWLKVLQVSVGHF